MLQVLTIALLVLVGAPLARAESRDSPEYRDAINLGIAEFLRSTGSVACWGSNRAGQLGNGTKRDSAMAAPVSGLSTPTSVAAGRSHTCALQSDGNIACWGRPFSSVGDETTIPVPILRP